MTNDLTKTDVKRGVDCIGVTVSFVCHDGNGKILLHKRSKNCRDEWGTWDAGGGALEFGEASLEDAVRREIKEEYLADVQQLQFIAVRNLLRTHEGQPTHWVQIMYFVQVDPAKAKIGEPDKMDDIGWFDPTDLPSPLHSALTGALQIIREKGLIK